MPEPKKIQALAEGGPVGGDPSLTVDDHDSEGRWPSPVVWRTRPGLDGRHVYVLSHMSDAGDVGFLPTYRFERTVGPSEPNPLAGRAKPSGAGTNPGTNLSTSEDNSEQLGTPDDA